MNDFEGIVELIFTILLASIPIFYILNHLRKSRSTKNKNNENMSTSMGTEAASMGSASMPGEDKKTFHNSDVMRERTLSTNNTQNNSRKYPTKDENAHTQRTQINAAAGWRKIESLSPMKKAMLLHEILGKPRGFSEKDVLNM